MAHIKGKKSHSIVAQGLLILIQVPDALFREEMAKQGVVLPPLGEYGVSMVFLGGVLNFV